MKGNKVEGRVYGRVWREEGKGEMIEFQKLKELEETKKNVLFFW